ncbi:MAG: hypothetical protein KQJ78_20720 [Deltaproteobacteria bacterium]|nr:hypothetical protein [Deltaproteobacteria bacterium]
MPLLKTVPVEQAEGVVKEGYDLFMNRFGMVPAPFRMYSASPGLAGVRLATLRHYMTSDRLSPGLMALIRLVVAEELGYHYCISLNSEVLRSLGILNDDQVAQVLADPANAPLPDNEKAMLGFVLKVVKSPEAVKDADVAWLRELGWSDQDMLDAAAHGTMMVADGILFKAFKMDEGESC